MDLSSIYFPCGESYSECLRKLYSVNSSLNTSGITMPSSGNLDNTMKLYELIGKPLDSIPTIHVGGTNGKGSTSYKIAKALNSCGITTGLFVSPHISSYRERVQINDVLISESDLVNMLPKIFKLCVDYSIPATLFEITFILACLHFSSSKCDAVVIEVGCGGKLDATNVILSELSIICSVSLDHTRILGSTVEEIARVKAGIFKPNKHALIGMGTPINVLKSEASSVGANLVTVDNVLSQNSGNMPFLSSINMEVDSIGGIIDTDHINQNITFAALSLLALKGSIFGLLLDSNMSNKIIASVACRPPCRWEIFKIPVTNINGESISITVILDVGHNPAAVAALSKRIKRDFNDKVVRILYGVSRDKDIRSCLKEIITCTSPDRIHFAQSQNFRAVSAKDLESLFLELSGSSIVKNLGDDLQSILKEALNRCANESTSLESVLVICGTGYIMPEIRTHLGVKEPRDDLDLNK